MDEHRTNTFLIAAIAIVAIVALVVLVMVYVQTSKAQAGKVVYDVVDKDGKVVGYAVDDQVYIGEQTPSGMAWKTVSRTAALNQGYTFKQRGNVNDPIGGGGFD
jgi:hypothetical protein